MTHARNPWRRFWPIVAVLSISTALLASGCMWGTVRDPSGLPLPGVNVSYSDSVGRTATTTTDGNGEYFFGAPPAPQPPMLGPATFNLSAPGYAPVTETRIMAYDDGGYNEVQDFILTGSGGGGTGGSTESDLELVLLYPHHSPVGNVFAQIKNHGPHPVTNQVVTLECGKRDVITGISTAPVQHTVNITLQPGYSADRDTGLSIDTSVHPQEVTCFLDPMSVNDLNMGNNGPLTDTISSGSSAPFQADLEVIDFFPVGPAGGAKQVTVEILNHGPDPLVNEWVTLQCEASICPQGAGYPCSTPISYYPAWTVELNLGPWQTQTIPTPHWFNQQTHYTDYALCTVTPQFQESGNAPNTYWEVPVT